MTHFKKTFHEIIKMQRVFAALSLEIEVYVTAIFDEGYATADNETVAHIG